MNSSDILSYVLESCPNTVLVETWGERAVFYNPQQQLKRGIYVLTIKEHDGPNDCASNLNRTGIYRVNFALKKEKYREMFGAPPKRPEAGGVVALDYQFSAEDVLLPHPVYAWMGWVSILNPKPLTFEAMKPLIEDAYDFATEKFLRRSK